jgi:1-acyl-sn-glycerol-3-phosphate acyltransferase
MSKRKVIGAVDRIDRRSFVYFSLYSWVNAVFNQYYRKVEVHGLENIPKDAPVIFAPNHQNALMDALIVLFSSPGDTVFLARADLFRKKLLAKALNTLKILPVFRIRDGVEELGKNQEIFDITVGVLHRKHQLCIMPEGNHADKRRLRNLGKGIFRIALKTQEKMGNNPYVKIVPVGLDFSDFVKHYQDLHVVYGKPIEVSEYWDIFVENGPRGMNLLKQRLAEELKPLMIHIETVEYYDMYMGLRTVFNERMREIMGIEGEKLHDRFVADKEMIRRLDALLEQGPAAAGEERKLTGEEREIAGAARELTGEARNLTGEARELTGEEREIAGTARELTGEEQEFTGDKGEEDVGRPESTGEEDMTAGGKLEQQKVGARLEQHPADKVVEHVPHRFDPLREKVEGYMKSLEQMNIRDWVVRSEGYTGVRTAWRWLTLLVTLPVFLYGLINNALVYFLPVRAVRNIKDVQFHSSVKAGLAMLVVVPLSYLVQTLLVGIFTDGWYYWAGYLVLLYPTGKLALLWYLRLKKTLRGGWFGRQYRRNNKAATALVQQRKEIIDITEKLIGNRHVTPTGV